MTNFEALQLLHGIQRKLLYVDQALNSLNLKEKHHMLDPTIAKVIKQIDDATNGVAARIQKFIDDANAAGSVTAAEVVQALQPEADRLSALGADPSNPVPPA